MAEERRLAAVAVEVDGRPLPTDRYDLLREVRVEESVQLPDTFVLRFADPHFELFDEGSFAMGAPVEIAFRAEGDMVTVTTGEITAVSLEQGPGGRHELVLSGLDAAHRLHREPKSRTFVEMTDADIASQIAGEHGLDTSIDPTREVHPYVIQSSESDFAFLARRASQVGYDLWVSHTTLHLQERPGGNGTPPTLRWGDNLRRFKVRFSAVERCDEVVVRAWDPVAKREIVGRASEGDRGTDAPGGEELAREARSAFGETRRFAGQFPVATQGEADALAHALLRKASGGEVVLRGEADGDPLLGAGAEVRVAGVGERLSGAYRITSVQHRYSAERSYVTRFVCGSKDPAGLADLVGASPGASAERRGWGSLVLGTVTNVDDPDRVGRVKVKFNDLEDTESEWAFVLAPGAGPERGLQWLPEVGDTVVVGFEHDDTRRPLVLGGLWNREDPPAEGEAVADGAVRSRLLRSRNGHLLEFLDEDQGSITLAMGDAESALSLAGEESALQGEQKLRVEGQEIEIEAGAKLVLRAPQIEIDADGEVKVSGSMIRLN